MVKKQVNGAEAKVIKSKPKKPATQMFPYKSSQPSKTVSQGAKKAAAASVSSKTQPQKSKPGASAPIKSSLLVSIKNESNAKRPRPIQGNKVAATDLLDDGVRDEVVSQMQLCEQFVSSTQNGIEIPTAGMEGVLRSSPTPNPQQNKDVPHVSTPFNKRLVSSTPDPERLLQMDDAHAISPSPQLMPERDTTPSETARLSLSGIGELLKQQKQNQLIWQQQLAQLQISNSSGGSDVQSGSAFYRWLGLPASTKSALEAVPMSGEDNEMKTFSGHAPKAEWESVQDNQALMNPPIPQSSENQPKSPRFTPRSRTHCNSYLPFTSQGFSSSTEGKWSDILSQPATDSKESSTVAVGQSQGHQITQEQSCVSVPKQASKTDEFKDGVASPANPHPNPSPQPESIKAQGQGQGQVLPASTTKSESITQANIKPKPKTMGGRPITRFGNRKKTKEIHSKLDERGVDVPPSNFSPSNLVPDVLKVDTLNDSMSTCSEEVNILTAGEKPMPDQSKKVKEEEEVKDSQNDKVPGVSPANMNVDQTKVDASFAGNAITGPNVHLNQTSDFVEHPSLQTDFNQKVSLEYQMELAKKQNQSPQTVMERHGSKNDMGSEKSVKNSFSATDVGDKVEVEEENVNQNYNDERRGHDGRRHVDLRYLERMADPTLHNIACRLALKATTLRDLELRNLIDAMIFHTDAALAHEDTKFQSSQMFFAEENSKLKKRIHTINKQLEAKERLEKQGDHYMGISNTDVMHLERKNLYLRQEKDRLDQQVTNLLEEKAKWLITQQDLVRTISLKDHEILKLEEKHQEEKKSLHQTLDQTSRNSQGVHFKLSVADKEISNLEQRVKSKDRDILELKEKMKDVETELESTMECSRKKDGEMSRLQDLVETLKLGVDEVLKAYEASGSDGGNEDQQRQGIDFLRQMAFSQPRCPHQSYKKNHDGPKRPFQSQRQESHGGGKTSRQRPPPHHQQQHHQPHHPPPPPHQHHHPHHQSLPERVPDLPSRWAAQDILDSSLKPPAGYLEDKHTDGSSLTLQAVEEHNRRYSPVDRTLWHSLDNPPVMPTVEGEEPYYSDSEIHFINTRGRRRQRHKVKESQNHDFIHHKKRHAASLSPEREGRLSHWEEEQSVRDSALQRDSERALQRDSERALLRDSERALQGKLGGLSNADWTGQKMGKHRGRIFTSTRRPDDVAGGKIIYPRDINDEDSNLISLPLEGEISQNEPEMSRYSVSDYFRQYSHRMNFDSLPTFPMKSQQHWRMIDDVQGSDISLEGQPSKLVRPHPVRHDRDKYDSTMPTSLKSASIPPEASSEDDGRRADAQRAGCVEYGGLRSTPNEVDFQNVHPGKHDSLAPAPTDPLSSSYPLYRTSRNGHPSSVSDEHTLMSASLPFPPLSNVSRDQNFEEKEFHDSHKSKYRSESVFHPKQQTYENMRPSGHRHNFQADDSGRSDQRRSYDEKDSSLDLQYQRVINSLPGERLAVAFTGGSDESAKTLPQSFQSDFLNHRSSFPTQSSPINVSDISTSRRATKGSNAHQREFFHGTELSMSCSSISDQDLRHDASDNWNNNEALDEESFMTGIASLDQKIARLTEKINHTKAVFS